MQITRKEGVGDVIFARKSLVLYNVAAVCIVCFATAWVPRLLLNISGLINFYIPGRIYSPDKPFLLSKAKTNLLIQDTHPCANDNFVHLNQQSQCCTACFFTCHAVYCVAT